ncbi:Protein gamma response 1 [Rhynchospora pubera]|uniref:Protein gamma response 1 n=1 Tax=Rhynchospora pubera TaxID=906938 RepID=A0AAV8GYG5_9POAL|nr:Protein gamma response 1 [Rhynchospora pubera]
MEEKPIDSPNLEIFTPKSDDFKYICSLSTILVATIQEVKDRVSQIELIFCSQLFPKFQSNSKSFLKSQEEWKERETNLLSQIEELRLGLLKEREEKEKLMKEIECKDQCLVAEQSKRRDVVRDFGTLKDRYNSLKSQYSYLIGKLEGTPGNLKSPQKARGEKMVKAHSPKRSHEVSGFDEIDTKEISPYAELRKPKLSLNSLSTSPQPPLNNTSEKEDKLSWCQTNKASSSPRLQRKSTSGKSKTETTSGQKRPITWRDTRANQKPCGANRDPHDC